MYWAKENRVFDFQVRKICAKYCLITKYSKWLLSSLQSSFELVRDNDCGLGWEGNYCAQRRAGWLQTPESSTELKTWASKCWQSRSFTHPMGIQNFIFKCTLAPEFRGSVTGSVTSPIPKPVRVYTGHGTVNATQALILPTAWDIAHGRSSASGFCDPSHWLWRTLERFRLPPHRKSCLLSLSTPNWVESHLHYIVRTLHVWV